MKPIKLGLARVANFTLAAGAVGYSDVFYSLVGVQLTLAISSQSAGAVVELELSTDGLSWVPGDVTMNASGVAMSYAKRSYGRLKITAGTSQFSGVIDVCVNSSDTPSAAVGGVTVSEVVAAISPSVISAAETAAAQAASSITASSIGAETPSGSQAKANAAQAAAVQRANHTGTQSPSTIATDASNRFVTDTEKSTWNAKETPAGAQAKADAAQSAAATDATTKANAAQAAAIAAAAEDATAKVGVLSASLGNLATRSVTVSTEDPSGEAADGAIWFKYTA